LGVSVLEQRKFILHVSGLLYCFLGVPLLFVYVLFSNKTELRGDRQIEVASAARAAKRERRNIHREDDASVKTAAAAAAAAAEVSNPQFESEVLHIRGGVYVAADELGIVPETQDFENKKSVLKRCRERNWELFLPAISEENLMEVRRRDVNLNGLHLLFDTYRPEVRVPINFRV
jgi:hypothetical protein